MRELIQLTDTELDLVSGGAGAAAAGAGTTSASAGSAENLGVNFLIVDGLIITVRGTVAAGGAEVLGPATLGAVATGN
jgi:hypothetical protein